jgi:hypothetical protein
MSSKTIRMVTITHEHHAALRASHRSLSKMVCETWYSNGPDMTASESEPFFSRSPRSKDGPNRYRTTISIDAVTEKSINKYRAAHKKFNFSAWVDWTIDRGMNL